MHALPLLLALVIAVVSTPPCHAKGTGLIFVSNEKTNNLIVIDPKTYQVVKDVKVCRRPRDMHFSGDRTRLYVACGDDDVIDIVDVAKLEVIGKLATGPSPETFRSTSGAGASTSPTRRAPRSPLSTSPKISSCMKSRPVPNPKACC